MRRSILLILFYICVFTTGYAQRIVKSAIDQEPPFYDSQYSHTNDIEFERIFILSDSSIVTISTQQYGFFITKRNKNFEVLGNVEIPQVRSLISYYSFMFNDVVYLFSHDYKLVSFYYEISCANKVSIQIKRNDVNKIVLSSQEQYVYMINEDNSSIVKVDMLTLSSQNIPIHVQNASLKIFDYDVVNGYIILTYKTENTAKSKDPSNSIVETVIIEKKTDKVNKISIDFLLDKTKMNHIDVASNKDSIYFITYSNKEINTTIEYKILGYDFSLDKIFLQKNAAHEFSNKNDFKQLSTIFFAIDPNKDCIILILDRFQMFDRFKTVLNSTEYHGPGSYKVYTNNVTGSSRIDTGMDIKKIIDFTVIYMNSVGDVLNTDFVDWPKMQSFDLSKESFYPEIMFVDGLVYFFISSYKMEKMKCYVYNVNGTLKEEILLFDKDPIDSKNVNISTIRYQGDGVFFFATVSNYFSKKSNFYMFKVYK